MVSNVEEEYIKTINFLQEKYGKAKTGTIANMLGIRPSSATEMLKRLERKGLIIYRPYYGSILTEQGKKIAELLNTRYEIIKNFLRHIGVKSRIAEVDACNIEHIISPESINQMKKVVEEKLSEVR
jgi:DtxR family Mn-dependent transcriptional regulator